MDRKQAKELGIKTYSGKPCRRCNTTEKYVNNCGCVECSKTIYQPSAEVRKRYEHSVKGKNVRKKINQSDAQKERVWEYNNTSKNTQKYYKNNPQKYLEYRLQKYNLSLDQYTRLLQEQNNCCKICCANISDDNHIDHCHLTGNVRGLLCRSCNTGLGLFKDNPMFLKNAITYLGAD